MKSLIQISHIKALCNECYYLDNVFGKMVTTDKFNNYI